MRKRIFWGILVSMLFLVQAASAGEKATIQKYFNKTACKVKATSDPEQKREILGKSLQTMSTALNKIESLGLVSQNDRPGFDNFEKSLQDIQNELMGTNGFQRIADAQLDAYSDYVVQNMEQASRNINISLVSALLIVIILILIL